MALYLLFFILFSIIFWWRGKLIENNFGINIYRTSNNNMRYSVYDIAPLNYRMAQIAQFGLLCGIESLFGAIIAVEYGPYVIVYWLLFTLLLGAAANYYCSMYAMVSGRLVPTLLKNKISKPIYILLLLILYLGLLLLLSESYAVLQYACGKFLMLSPWWHIILILIIYIAFCRQQQFNWFCIANGFLMLAACAYMLYSTRGTLLNLQIDWHWQSYPNLRYAYPLCFFVAGVCTVSGLQCLKSALLAPSIKNEKMGRGIFWLMPLIHTLFVSLWTLIIISISPSTKVLRKMVANSINPFDVWQNILSGAVAYGSYVFFTILFCGGILACGAILRILMQLSVENRLLRKNNYIFSGVIFLLIAINFYFTKMESSFFELAAQVVSLILFGGCALLLQRQYKSSIAMQSGFVIWFGACAAYLAWMILPFDYLLIAIFGVCVTLLVILYKIIF